jgi:hypothetical protein
MLGKLQGITIPKGKIHTPEGLTSVGTGKHSPVVSPFEFSEARLIYEQRVFEAQPSKTHSLRAKNASRDANANPGLGQWGIHGNWKRHVSLPRPARISR